VSSLQLRSWTNNERFASTDPVSVEAVTAGLGDAGMAATDTGSVGSKSPVVVARVSSPIVAPPTRGRRRRTLDTGYGTSDMVRRSLAEIGV